MINVCGHSLCKYCVEKLFNRNTGPCPTCGKTLNKNAFWEQQFDDPIVEKEVYFRKKLQRTFNLKQEDFATLEEFNAYLQEIEEIVFNFVFDRNFEETEKRVKEFRKENAHLIEKNKTKKSKDEEWIAAQLAEEQSFKERIQNYQLQESENAEWGNEQNEKDATDQELIKELMKSDLPAELVVGNKRRKLEEAKRELEEKEKLKKAAGKLAAAVPKSKTGWDSSGQQNVIFAPVLEALDGEPFVYESPQLETNGPDVPPIGELGKLGYLKNIRSASVADLAAGYTEAIACCRALTEAFCDMYL